VSDDRADFEVYVGGGDLGGSSEDLLEAGRARQFRVPRRAWVLVAVLLLVGGGLAKIATQRPHHDSVSFVPDPSTSSAPAAPHTDALSRLIILAESVGPLAVDAPTGAEARACPAVPAGVDPAGTAAAVIQRNFAGFTLQDLSVARNPDGTLCSLVLREHDPIGTIVIIQIDAPPFGVGPAFTVERDNDRTTAVEVASFSDGWQVQVAGIGQTGTQVGSAELQPIADDSALRW
jgi:hypothetical protein